MSKLKVVYITGYGRSGTTILDMMLGQHPNIFGMGELSFMTRSVWANDEYCACRKPISKCEFWGPIMRAWIDAGYDPEAYLHLQQKVEPLLSHRRWWKSSVLEQFLLETRDLLQRVSTAAGVDTLVDSSKSPGRGLALAQDKTIDLRVLHVVRDGRAVAHSMTRPYSKDVAKGLQLNIKPKPGYRTAFRWRSYNHFAEKLCEAVGEGKHARIRYEDFTRSPTSVMEDIGNAVGLDMAPLVTAIEASRPIRASHQMAGSRIRMTDHMTLREDKRWVDEISKSTASQVTRVAGDQLRRYGYIQ